MIAFHLEYTVLADRVPAFEVYARKFVELTKKYGGKHFGYFLQSTEEKTTAIAVFSFSGLPEYDVYRKSVLDDPEYESAMELAKRSGCIKTCCRTVYEHHVA